MNNLNVAVCDDEERLAKLIREKLIAYSIQKNVELKIHMFESGDHLLEKFPKDLEVLFLDMEMPGRNGLETAMEIRKNHKDLLIIFLTAYKEYVFDSFSVDAFRYLLKPVDNQLFCEAMDAVFEKKSNPEETLNISFNGEVSRIRFEDIICFEVMNRKIWIYCVDKTYRWTGNLNELNDQIHDKGFFRVNRSFMINMSKVVRFTNTTVELEQGHELKISRSRLNEFKEDYMKKWSEHV